MNSERGGIGMKRTIKFKPVEKGYACFEDEISIFSISSDSLQFEIKDFYQAFYAKDKDYSDIAIENCCNESDSNGRRILECIQQLMSRIKEKLEEDGAKEIHDDEGDGLSDEMVKREKR